MRDITKRSKKILDAEYKEISLKEIVTSLDFLKDRHKDSLLNLLEKTKTCQMEP